MIMPGKSKFGKEHPTYFVADIAANHDGDLQRAKNLIALAAEAGADAAKFQHFKATSIVSDYGFKSLGNQLSHQKTWEKSVYQVYDAASIPDDWTPYLYEECCKRGIDYATSPYNIDAIDKVKPYVAFYKIGSGEITWHEICLHMAKTGKPIFLATGASSIDDVERLMEALLPVARSLVIMQCNTNYTGSRDNFSHVNLHVLKTYAKRWPDLTLGFSDHTPGHAAVLGAVALGARVIEKHFTDDTSRKGPDHAFSLTPHAWREMVSRTRELEMALGDGIKRVEANEQETVILQRRSLRAVQDFPVGHVLKKEDLIPLRPAPHDSFPPYLLESVIGKPLVIGISTGEHLQPRHIASQKGEHYHA